ncbi:MAG: BON domain-containing protein [Alphaproteobacteria bacterium]
MSAAARLTAGLGPLLALALVACTPVLSTVESVADVRSAEEVVDDSVIHTRIATALARESGALFFGVETSVFQSRVMLTGAVKKRADYDAAARLANSVGGVREVVNELQVTDEGGFAAGVGDLTIETKLKAKLVGDDEVHSANYRWKSVNGTVYFLGVALGRAELDRVFAAARDTEGVRKVVSHVQVRS